jgi:hypothetical protein
MPNAFKTFFKLFLNGRLLRVSGCETSAIPNCELISHIPRHHALRTATPSLGTALLTGTRYPGEQKDGFPVNSCGSIAISAKFRLMKNKSHFIIGACIAALAFSAPLAAQTTPSKSTSPSLSPNASASPAASSGKPSVHSNPFHGMVSAIDQSAKTFTIAGKTTSRVFKVTDKTVVTKAGNPAAMADIVENQEVSGLYRKNADGTLEAKTVKIGPMNEKKSGDEGKKSKATSSPVASPAASPKS